MDVRFGNHRVKNNEILSLTTAQKPFSVSWNGSSDGIYSLIVYDLSIPGKSPYVHFWAQNIPGDDLSQGNILIPYQPPSPPDGTHDYVIDLFQQPRNYGNSEIDMKLRPRENFPIETVANSSGLIHRDRSTFQVTSGYQTRSRQPTNKASWTSGLNEEDAKYCRAVVEVAAKQTPSCLKEQAWREYREGEMCYNPYAIAHKSVQGEAGRIDCGSHYVYENLPDLELIGYANLNRLPIPDPYDRLGLIQNIYSWKGQKRF